LPFYPAPIAIALRFPAQKQNIIKTLSVAPGFFDVGKKPIRIGDFLDV